MQNNTVEKYVVVFPGYNSELDEYSQNYSSYSTKLDNIQGMTKSLSQAYAAANAYHGTIYALINGEYKEVKRKGGKE